MENTSRPSIINRNRRVKPSENIASNQNQNINQNIPPPNPNASNDPNNQFQPNNISNPVVQNPPSNNMNNLYQAHNQNQSNSLNKPLQTNKNIFPPQNSTNNKLDPKSLPNPSKVQPNTKKNIYSSSSFSNPPLAYSKFIVNERSNCSPRYIRSSLSQIPINHKVSNQSNIPIGLVIQPLAEPGIEEEEVSIVDMGSDGPLRCRRCGAYINPFVKFMDGGRFYECPFCSTQNEIPDNYFSPIEANGMRRDLSEREELWRGSVDFGASSDLASTRISNFQIILFLIDVTFPSINSGLLRAFTNSINQILELEFLEDSNTQFGFITFDKSVHFWKLVPYLEMIVVPDIKNMFQPMSHKSFLLNYSDNKNLIQEWITKIETVFEDTKITESCFGSAMNAAVLSIGSMGGKIIAFQSSLPNFGPGFLENREDVKLFGRDSENILYKPKTKYYSDLAIECSKKSISIDMFIASSCYIDLASTCTLSQITGGQVNYFPFFNISQHEEKLFFDLRNSLTRKNVSEAVGRLRTSQGLVVESYYGHFQMNETDLEFSGMDSDKTIAVELKHDGDINEKNNVTLQWAMIYTNGIGQRLIRVHTISFHVSSILPSLFKSADLEAVMNLILRKSINQIGSISLFEIRKSLSNTITSILASYKKHCSKSEKSSSQLILPESLKLLPLYTLGAFKKILLSNPLISQNKVFPSFIDARIYMSGLIQTISLESFLVLLYPHIYPIHHLYDLLEKEKLKNENPSSESDSSSSENENKIPLPGDEDYYGSYWLPRTIRASYSEIEQGGIYIMDDGQNIYLVLNPPINPEMFGHLFNEKGQFVQTDDDFNVRVFNIIQAIRFRRSIYQPFYLFEIHSNNPQSINFSSNLIEDGDDNYMNKEMINSLFKMSYTAYLCHIHNMVQELI